VRDTAHLTRVRLRVEGANSLALDERDVRANTAVGEYRLPLLQLTGATRVRPAAPGLSGDEVSAPFAGDEDVPEEPEVAAGDCHGLWSTYLGGNSWDDAVAIDVDDSNNVYVTGSTYSSDFPHDPGYGQYRGNYDIFITKFDPSLQDVDQLRYSVLLGTTSEDRGFGIAVDKVRGYAYVVGRSSGPGYPLFREFQDYQHEGAYFSDAVLTKIDPTGAQLRYSTYFGAAVHASDEGRAIVLGYEPEEGQGIVYITGGTASGTSAFLTPGAGPIQPWQQQHQLRRPFEYHRSLRGQVRHHEPLRYRFGPYSSFLGGSGCEFGTGSR
jgi:hypothetical protein